MLHTAHRTPHTVLLFVAVMDFAQTHSPVAHQGIFTGSNALQLFYQSWYPNSATALPSTAVTSTAVKGVLVLVHGLGEHSGRYCNVVKALTEAGYAVYAFDNQGHGKSEGQRGHIDRWQDYRNNISNFLQLVRQQEPTAPMFLMGHSLGGLIVLDYVLRSSALRSNTLRSDGTALPNQDHPEDHPENDSSEFAALNLIGIVVSAPPIQPAKGTASSVRIMIARLLSGLLPRLSLKMGLDKKGLSRSPEAIEDVVDDPLIHPYVTLRWGSETLKTISWVKANIDQLCLPILLTHGDADPIIAPAGSCEIFQQIPTPNKTLTLYPGSYHEPHNDLDADVVTTDLVNWLNECIAAA